MGCGLTCKCTQSPAGDREGLSLAGQRWRSRARLVPSGMTDSQTPAFLENPYTMTHEAEVAGNPREGWIYLNDSEAVGGGWQG